MLLLDVDNGVEPLVQGFVRARWPAANNLGADQVASWVRFFLRSTALWNQAKPRSVALRLFAKPGFPITTVHSFVVPKSEEARLRLVLAAFLRTSEMAGAETVVPQLEAELITNFVHPDEFRAAIRYEPLSTRDGSSIQFNLRLVDLVPQIIQTLIDFAVPVAYEAQVTPWLLPREPLKKFLYDAGRLEESHSTPPELVSDQRALAERLTRAAQQRPAYHIEECLCTAKGVSSDVLTGAVSNHLSKTIYGSLGVSPQFVQLDEERAEAFAFHVHSHVMNGPPDLLGAVLGAAATKDEVDRLLSCRALLTIGAPTGVEESPGREPLFTTLTGTAIGVVRPNATGPFPPISVESENPFLFVSYARKDRNVIHPLVDALSKRGVSIWMDSRMLGGDDWLAELEAELIKCSGVLVLLSSSSMSSKYCHREVHFADALNKPIIPIALDPGLVLSDGLKFMLTRTQIINFYETSALEDILISIRRHAPLAFSSAIGSLVIH
jgi:hypothetical protein